MHTKVKGHTWCPTCNKSQPSILQDLIQYDTFQEIRGVCTVCNRDVSKKITTARPQVITYPAKLRPLDLPPSPPVTKTNPTLVNRISRSVLFLVACASYLFYELLVLAST